MSSAPSFITPLRYPGGKARLGAWLGELLRHNKISGGWYVEPYAGGAGAAVYLLMHGYVNHIVINDVDPAIYAFWWSVLNDCEGLVEKIETTDVTVESWHQQRKIIKDPQKHSLTTIGFATFFLNRTNRSGILSAGVIGGQKQTGNYKIDARYNKATLAERIKKIHSLKTHISLYNLDALELIDKINPDLPENCLIYFDPPYFNKGSQLYRNHYKPEDHKEISAAVRRLEKPWLVTYDNCDQIKELYPDSARVEFSLHYSTHLKRPKATEIMFYDKIELHDHPMLRR